MGECLVNMETDWRDMATSQWVSKIAKNHQELGEKHGTDSLLEPQIGNNPADTLILKRASLVLVQTK